MTTYYNYDVYHRHEIAHYSKRTYSSGGHAHNYPEDGNDMGMFPNSATKTPVPNNFPGTFTLWTGMAFNENQGYYPTGTNVGTFKAGDPNPTAVGYYVFPSGLYVHQFRSGTYVRNGETYRKSTEYGATRTVTGVERGSFYKTIVAEEGKYPIDGVSGSFWYVRRDIANALPQITLETPNNRTLYETDTYTIEGTSKDTDAGNVVTVRYQVNALPSQAIATHIADGTDKFFSKSLTFKDGKLFDGNTALTGVLTEGTQYSVKVWAEDDNGGKSDVQTRYFYVVPNRPANLTIDPLTTKTGLIDSDKVTISGAVSDPDNNAVTVKYKIGNQAYTEVYSGNGGAFTFEVPLSKLNAGNNTLSIRATDSYGVTTDRVISVEKSGTSIPLKQSVARYKLTPPNGTASGIILWINREVGDLIVSARASMVMNGESEVFQDMTLSGTAFLSDGTEEDEFILDAGSPKDNITLEITLLRSSTASNKGIKLISGVLN